MDQPLLDYIRSLPKTELHLHLEGSVRPTLLSKLADKYSTGLAGRSPEQVESEVYRFTDFHEFLDAFATICRHLRSPEDYLLVFEDLGSYLKEQGIAYAEVICSPAIAWRFGLDGREILSALLEASASFERKSGIKVRWILDCVRQWGRESAERTAELASEFRPRGVVGVGLGGDEKSLPALEFEEVFAWIRAHQLYVHVHAGEIGGPSEVWDALQILGANRIGHGIHAARDAELMDTLRERGIGLDICLTSNTRTRAWPMLKDHPISLFLRRGVPVSLNTDDPGLFGTTLCEEIAKAVEFIGLSAEDLERLVLQGVRSSFLPHGEKMEQMQAVQNQMLKLSGGA